MIVMCGVRSMAEQGRELWLIRHGETQWSASRRHTGRTDVPLNDHGRCQASELGKRLAGRPFALVLSSPLSRALETCGLAGYGDVVKITEDLCEWDYGDYEGLSTEEIRKEIPDWTIWEYGPPGGETLEQVAGRACKVIDMALSAAGDVALFAHGHLLRILASCWLGLAPDAGRFLVLSTASMSILGHERETRVIVTWNQGGQLLSREKVCISI
jgi:broad specificity phosphatase PhoE